MFYHLQTRNLPETSVNIKKSMMLNTFKIKDYVILWHNIFFYFLFFSFLVSTKVCRKFCIAIPTYIRNVGAVSVSCAHHLVWYHMCWKTVISTNSYSEQSAYRYIIYKNKVDNNEDWKQDCFQKPRLNKCGICSHEILFINKDK